MKVNYLIGPTYLLSLLVIPFGGCENSSRRETSADQVHDHCLTVDSHADTPFWLLREGFNLAGNPDSLDFRNQVDLEKMKLGGLDAVFFAVFVPQGSLDDQGYQNAVERAKREFKAIHQAVEGCGEMAGIGYTPEDAHRNEKDQRRTIYIGIENGYAIADSILLVEEYYHQGARYITLCHTKNNGICDSSTDPSGPVNGGLSDFGRQVVAEMNRLGIMVDVSHVSDQSFFDILEVSKTPVIASHSDTRSLCNNPRNLTDSMLLALAANGGVIQMSLLSAYVKEMTPNEARDSAFAVFHQKYPDYGKLSDKERNKADDEWEETDRRYPAKLATVSDLADHIDHVVGLAGIDHVGIGSDFDGGGRLLDCQDAGQFENITVELMKRGYNKEDICKIWGGNLMRVFSKVTAYALEHGESPSD